MDQSDDAAIRAEIAEIENGTMDHDSNPLKNAPHTVGWSARGIAYSANRMFPRAFPTNTPLIVDNAYGDRNLIRMPPNERLFTSGGININVGIHLSIRTPPQHAQALPDKVDVVIIGGGVIGICTAILTPPCGILFS